MAYNHQGIRHDMLTARYLSHFPGYSRRNLYLNSGYQEQPLRQQNVYSGGYPVYDNEGYLTPNTLKSHVGDKSDMKDPQSEVRIVLIHL